MREFTARQRLAIVASLALMAGILLLVGSHILRDAWVGRNASFGLCAINLALALLLLVPGAAMVLLPIRRKLRTGRFLLTRAEILAKRAESRARMGAGKPFWPQARDWVALWAILAVLAGFGIAALIAAIRFRESGGALPELLLLLAAALLLLPAHTAVKAVLRKRRTGSFLPSQEELDKARAKCARPKSLPQRIAVAGIFWLMALIWTSSLLSRHRPYHGIFGSVWVVIALWWIVALIWTWRIFHPAASHCSIDPEEPLSIKPPEAGTQD